jgi:hypothetical protein
MTQFVQGPFSGPSEYLDLKERLWRAFYALDFSGRVNVLVNEALPMLVFSLGYSVYEVFTPTSYRLVMRIFDMSAMAQTFGGMTKPDWQLAIWVVFHLTLLAILVGCVGHMLFSGRASTWVAKTATFLLGFLTKAITSFAAA